MTDHWLYSRELPAAPANWTLEGDEAQHARVKRLETGEMVHLFDGRGRLASARVSVCDKRALSVQIEGLQTVEPRQPHLTVAVSQPKGDRLDWMLEKLTEIGVAAIWPLECERSVAYAKQERIDRWQRRVIEAAKQAHVAWLPSLQPSHKLQKVLERAGEFTHLFVADTTGQTMPILAGRPGPQDRLLILIGPEGGFSDSERERLNHAGAQRVSLGATVLRTESAAIVAAGCLLAAGDLAAWAAGRSEG